MSLADIQIKGFIESSFLDWPGKISSIIFLAGCNFRCPFCHNHALVLDPDQYETITWEDIKDRLAGFTGWIDGIVISGGEPTFHPDLRELIVEIKNTGFLVKLDTNGSNPEMLAELIDSGLVSCVAMDIKAPLNELAYARATGTPGYLKQVLQSLEILKKSNIQYLLRTTVVPTLHSEEDIMTIAGQLGDVPDWVLQKFEPGNAMNEDFSKLEQMDQETFENLQELAKQWLKNTS